MGKINRRSFFQIIMTVIGALVGHKYLPKAEAKTPEPISFDDFIDFKPEDCAHIGFKQFANDCIPMDYTWITATKCVDGIMRQCRYRTEPDGGVVVDWFRVIQLKDDNPNTTVEIRMNDYEQFLNELVRLSTGTKTNSGKHRVEKSE